MHDACIRWAVPLKRWAAGVTYPDERSPFELGSESTEPMSELACMRSASSIQRLCQSISPRATSVGGSRMRIAGARVSERNGCAYGS